MIDWAFMPNSTTRAFLVGFIGGCIKLTMLRETEKEGTDELEIHVTLFIFNTKGRSVFMFGPLWFCIFLTVNADLFL